MTSARAARAIVAAATITALSTLIAPTGLAAGGRRAAISVNAPSRVVRNHRFNVVVSGRPKRKTLLLVFYEFRPGKPLHCTRRAGGEFARGAGVLAHGIATRRFRVVARRLYSSRAGTITYCGYLTRSLAARPDARTRAATTVVPR